MSIFIRQLALLMLVVLSTHGQQARLDFQSKWDESLPGLQINDVRISAESMEDAWQQICTKYLIRANLYLKNTSTANSAKFSYHAKQATGKELIEALLASFPEYTYTQEKNDLVWIHPKNISCDDILSQKVRLDRPEYQVAMFTQIYQPLCRLLAPKIIENPVSFGLPDSYTFDYSVNLPNGVYSAREILDFCCIANPTKCFKVYSGPSGPTVIYPINLYSDNPLAPRASAVKFWEVEIGLPTNSVPNSAELSIALCDSDPGKRWAARNYLESAWNNYSLEDLITSAGGAENRVWTAIGIRSILARGETEDKFILHLTPDFINNFAQIKAPGLALVASLELSMIKQDSGYLDSIVNNHKFTESEIASVKPDVYRLAHESHRALDKLKSFKLEAADFSPGALRNLEITNFLILVPDAPKQTSP